MGYCSYIMSLLLCASLAAVAQAVEQEVPSGAPVRFQLPTDGPLPRTYRVTLAAVDKDNPDWIFGTIVAGEPYTVTEDNQGRFTAYWNGLDDNYMPMPTGEPIQWHARTEGGEVELRVGGELVASVPAADFAGLGFAATVRHPNDTANLLVAW